MAGEEIYKKLSKQEQNKVRNLFVFNLMKKTYGNKERIITVQFILERRIATRVVCSICEDKIKGVSKARC